MNLNLLHWSIIVHNNMSNCLARSNIEAEGLDIRVQLRQHDGFAGIKLFRSEKHSQFSSGSRTSPHSTPSKSRKESITTSPKIRIPDHWLHIHANEHTNSSISVLLLLFDLGHLLDWNNFEKLGFYTPQTQRIVALKEELENPPIPCSAHSLA